MQSARRDFDVLRLGPAGFYHWLRIVGPIVVALAHANRFSLEQALRARK